MEDFNDKIIVITGGATGIGLALARAFGREGAKLVLSARRENRLREAVDALTSEGIEASYATCDVTDLAQVEALADTCWERHGHVDVIVNNAGMNQPAPGPVIAMPMADVHKVLGVNLFGVWHGSAVFGRRFVEQGTPAAIYNIGSENSLFNAVPGAAAYVASKHAVLAMTDALREEMPDFVDVSLICPGFVRSELGPAELMSLGMDTDKFAATTLDQLKAGRYFVVSHAYNMAHIDQRYEEIRESFATYAPRYEGDAEFDIRTLAQRMSSDQ